MQKIIIDFSHIKSFDDFHRQFKEKLGFPDFYGMNMNAWIDCMSSLDSPKDGMSQIHIKKNEVLIIEGENIDIFKKNFPDIYNAFIEGSAFVNYRSTKVGGTPLISLSFYS